MDVRGDSAGGEYASAPTDDVEGSSPELTAGRSSGLLAGDLPLRDVFRMGSATNEFPYEAAAVPRLGIPGIRFADWPRAASCSGGRRRFRSRWRAARHARSRARGADRRRHRRRGASARAPISSPACA